MIILTLNILHTVYTISMDNGYLSLLEQRNQLTLPLFDGVKAAKSRLHIVNSQIAKIEKNPKVFEPLFVHRKPGYTKSVVHKLAVMAGRGSTCCQDDLSSYANWVIEQNKFRLAL